MKPGLLIILICFSIIGHSQKADRKLAAQIQKLTQDFHGDIGVYIKNLRTGKTVSIKADTIFSTASIVKVPILVGIMDRINKGKLGYDSSLTYTDSLLYAGSDILGSFKNNERISLKKVIMLMLTTSDNTASLWLQSLAGTGTRINELMDSLGIVNTKVNSRTPGRETNRTKYGWGQTTPKEMATLFEKIYRKDFFSAETCDKMLRCLGRNFWDEQALSQIPPTIEVFSKNGAVNASRSEVLLVNAPKNPYILSIFTQNNKDQSWGENNEAWELTKKISKLVWEYYQ